MISRTEPNMDRLYRNWDRQASVPVRQVPEAKRDVIRDGLDSMFDRTILLADHPDTVIDQFQHALVSTVRESVK